MHRRRRHPLPLPDHTAAGHRDGVLPHGTTTIEVTNPVSFRRRAERGKRRHWRDWNLLAGKSAGRRSFTSARRRRRPAGTGLAVDRGVDRPSGLSRCCRGSSPTWPGRLLPCPHTLRLGAHCGRAGAQRLSAEGDSGLLFSAVTWSDGAVEDVGVDALEGLDEIHSEVGTASIVAFPPRSVSNSDKLWKVGVAVGASKECVTNFLVNWTVCGSTVASASVPMFLDIPDPSGATLTSTEAKLTAPDDDAVHQPISLKTSSGLQLILSFSDGSSRDMTADNRVATDNVQCGTADDATNTVASATGARRGSLPIRVTATIAIGSRRWSCITRCPSYLDTIVLTCGLPAWQRVRLTALCRSSAWPGCSSALRHK